MTITNPNSGHGHVRPRPDGVKARCGGPAMCRVCQQERAAIDALQSTHPADASKSGAQIDIAQPSAPSGEPAARCELVESCRKCRHSVGRQSCALAGRDFDGAGIPAWCPLPVYGAAPLLSNGPTPSETAGTASVAGLQLMSASDLLKAWQDAACVRFVSRSSGQRTTDTVSRDDLIQLINAARDTSAAPQAAPAPQPSAPSGEPAEPIGYITGIKWHHDPRWQSEQCIKVTRRPQPQYDFTVPVYAGTTPAAQAPQAEAEERACSRGYAWGYHDGRNGLPHSPGLENIRRILAGQAPQAAHTAAAGLADHVPAGTEAEAATDAKLGLVLLPPIRVDRATHAALQEAAKAQGVIVQAIVRDRLAPYAIPGAAPQAAHTAAPADLLRVAIGTLAHDRMGGCPDEVEGWAARDPQCAACRAIMAAEAAHAAAAELARPMTERDQFDMAMWHARLGELADAYYEAGRTNPARQRARADLMLHALECATGWRTRFALAAHTAAAPPPAQAQAEPNNLPVGRVRVSDGELHIHPSVRDPDDRDALKDGQYVYATPPAAAAPQAQAVPPGLRRAAELTREDLGPHGKNYPHVRELLAFAESALGITAAPSQQGE